MQRGLYSSATAMVSAQQMLDVVSHNLANVSTNGYKRDGLVFNEQFDRAMYSSDGRLLGKLGTGSWKHSQYTVMESGSLTTTGNALDVAVQGPKGLFAVQTPNGVRYTRNGSFTMDSDRRLTTQEGFPVLDGSNKEITLKPGTVEINDKGEVSVDGTSVGKIGVFDGNVTKVGDGLFAGQDMASIDEPNLQPGTIEGSNVNAIKEMIAMIQVNRIFEMAQRGALSQDEMTQKLLSSLQDR